MSRIFVSGLANMETSCRVGEFPVEYSPVDYSFFGVQSAPSGVGLNIALALSALSDEVTFLTYVGDDAAGDVVRSTAEKHIAHNRFLKAEETAQSVVLFDESGRRKIYTDLKNLQDKTVAESEFDAFSDADAFCLCNINFNRGILDAAKKTGKPIFSDVHCLWDVNDDYNRDFMNAADVLFLSNENIRDREEEFVKNLARTYPCKVIGVGMGEAGALLFERESGEITYVPAVKTRAVVNTVGAGDALFSAFTHFYAGGLRAEESLRRASVFASWEIGESGAGKGFLTADELEKIYQNYQ